MKKLIVFLIIIMLFPLIAAAESENMPEGYAEQYSLFDTDKINDGLPDKTKNQLEQFGISPEDENWVNSISAESAFEHIIKIFRTGAAAPLSAGFLISGIILISAAFPAFSPDGKVFEAARFAQSLSVSAIVVSPVWSCVTASAAAVKGCSSFMLSFIPVFTAVVCASGGALTSVSMSALLLGAAEFTASFATFGILPLMGSYLAIGITSGISPLLQSDSVADGIKKIAFWGLSLVCTVFVGILSIQNAVNSAADSVSLKTAKFILGSSVPIAGSYLAEAAATVKASLGLLRSSVGIYGAVALAVILLPVIAELLLWRLILAINKIIAEMLSQNSILKILKAVDTMLSLLVSVILTVGTMFIISLTVTVNAGRQL